MNDKEFEELTKQLETIEKMAKQYMSKEAISRYGNLKIAHLETAVKAITLIAQAGQVGQVKEQLTDMEFRELLMAIQEGKKTFKFKV